MLGHPPFAVKVMRAIAVPRGYVSLMAQHDIPPPSPPVASPDHPASPDDDNDEQ